jgi:Zn ribbon nucleic-acid-binding protein
MMKRGVKIDPKLIDFYNEKAIRLWEEKFCLKCATCTRMIPHSQKDSHKRLCVPMPQISAPTESLPEAVVKDFPYEPKQLQKTGAAPNTESTEYSFNSGNESLAKIVSQKLSDYPEEEVILKECIDCGRKFKADRVNLHQRACEN